MTKNITIALLVIISVVSVLYGLQQKQRADDNESRATKSEQLVSECKKTADEQRMIAEQQRLMAEDARMETERHVQALASELKRKQ